MRWTKLEEKILQGAFQQGGWKAAQQALAADNFIRSRHSIITRAHKLGLKDLSHWWTEEEIQILKESYAIGGSLLAIQALEDHGYKRTPKAVKGKAKVLGLKAPDNGQFRKGVTPPSKGKGMSDEVKMKVSQTWYTKGHIPTNTLHDGAITIRTSKGGRPIKHIRTAPKVWHPYHRFLWEQEHGAIPKGMVIYFKDGDSLNCTLDNLAMRTRSEHLRSNIQLSGGRPGHLLTDGYVRAVLKRSGIDAKVITPEMIDLKRAELLLKREIKSHECNS